MKLNTCFARIENYEMKNNKRSNDKSDINPVSQSPPKKAKKNGTKKSIPFVWGQPGLYSRFLELCNEQMEEEKLNVFEDGGARDAIAFEINKKWPGCTGEKIRTKLRQQSAKDDLFTRNNEIVPVGMKLFKIAYFNY